MAPSPGETVALTQPRTAPARFESPDSISSSGKKVKSLTEPSKSSSSILAFKRLISRLARDTGRAKLAEPPHNSEWTSDPHPSHEQVRDLSAHQGSERKFWGIKMKYDLWI